MLIVHSGPREKVGVNRVVASGDMIDIVGDVTLVLRTIHKQLNASGPEFGKAFKETIQKIAADDEGPFWTMPIDGVGFSMREPKKEDT